MSAADTNPNDQGNTAEVHDTPSQVLAARIASRLVTSGLIEEDRKERLGQNLAAGSISQADWRLEIERKIDHRETETDAT